MPRPSTDIAAPWFSRLLRGLSSLWKADPSPDEVDYGADFAQGLEQPPRYSPDSAASAAETFAWVYAAILRRSAAVAKLPIVVYRREGKTRIPLPDHWLLDLVERPSVGSDGFVFRRDLACDLLLTGDAMVKVVDPAGLGKGTASLQRLHPNRVNLETDRSGVAGYLYDIGGERIRLSPDVVCHVRLPSFRSDPDQLFRGVGAVQPLNDELNAEQAAVLRTKEAANQGRPDVILAPSGEGQTFTDDQRKGIRLAWTQMTRSSNGGAVVMGGAVQATPVTWTLRDLEFGDLRRYSREGILAALAVPPVVLGLETANYATAREQAGRFWEAIEDEVSLFDAALLTRLLRMAGERDTYAEHDTTGIQALRTWRSDAIQRATGLYFLGVDRDVALRAEGLEDVADLQASADAARKVTKTPAPKTQPETVETPAEEPSEVAEGARPNLVRGPRGWWDRLSRRDAPAPAPSAPQDAPDATEPSPWPPVAEDARAGLWRGFVEQLHNAAERSLALAVRRALTDQADRLAAALPAAWPAPQKSAPGTVTREALDVDSILAAIFDADGETAALEGATAEVRRSMLERAIRLAIGQVAAQGGWDPARTDEIVDAALASKIVDQAMEGDGFSEVTDTTRDAVREILQEGLADGATIADMQWRIQNGQAFSPARALRIARTETTRSVNAGSLAAYDAAGKEAGVIVDRQWLSARDESTRPEHWALDGQTVGPGAKFTIPASGNGFASSPEFVGAQADAPGGFDSAAMVCNCRCTVIPVLRAESAAKETA